MFVISVISYLPTVAISTTYSSRIRRCARTEYTIITLSLAVLSDIYILNFNKDQQKDHLKYNKQTNCQNRKNEGTKNNWRLHVSSVKVDKDTHKARVILWTIWPTLLKDTALYMGVLRCPVFNRIWKFKVNSFTKIIHQLGEYSFKTILLRILLNRESKELP